MKKYVREILRLTGGINLEKIKKYIKPIVLVLCVSVFCTCGALLIMTLIEDADKEKAVNEALQTAQQTTEELNPIISVIEENKPEETASEGESNESSISDFIGGTSTVNTIKRLTDVLPPETYATIAGVLSVPERNVKCSLVYGVSEENLKANAGIHELSYTDSLVVLGHNYRNGTMFHNLLNTEVGDEVNIEFTDGTIMKYNIAERVHLTEDEYNADYSVLFESTYDLVLVTCENINMKEGRCVLYCNIV